MPAVHVPAARQTLANRAGQTSAGLTPPTASPVTPHEVVTTIFHPAAGDLSALVSGGFHPENPVPTTVPTDIEKATNSVQGRLGGMRPVQGSVVQPGPAGRVAAAAGRARTAIEKLV